MEEGLEIDVPDYSDILIPNHKNEISDPEKKITDSLINQLIKVTKRVI